MKDTSFTPRDWWIGRQAKPIESNSRNMLALREPFLTIPVAARIPSRLLPRALHRIRRPENPPASSIFPLENIGERRLLRIMELVSAGVRTGRIDWQTVAVASRPHRRMCQRGTGSLSDRRVQRYGGGGFRGQDPVQCRYLPDRGKARSSRGRTARSVISVG